MPGVWTWPYKRKHLFTFSATIISFFFTNMKMFLAYVHILIFLSSTSISLTNAKFTKTGCDGMCGNVRIPYPFGIGEECSINRWYNVDCKSSTPYLSALNHLEVLSVNLEDQIVTINAPKISDCQHPVQNKSMIMGMNLGRSPFLFSKIHNIFVLKGCGVAVLMDNESVVTGCSTACLNVTHRDENKCSGNGCCQTKIPRYLKSYNINMETQGEGGTCGSAFLVDRSFYASLFDSYIPISLLWILSDSNQVTCCNNRDPQRLKVDMFNNTTLYTLKCEDGRFSDNAYLIDGCTEYGIPKYAKTGCNDMCGNVRIPYPFGIGASCSINQWYIVDCNSSKPYLPALNHSEVLGVSLENVTITIKSPRMNDCKNLVRDSSEIIGVDLGRSPFLFGNNKFVFEGCGVAALMDNESVVTACSTTCAGVTLSNRNDCIGIGCCETTIPYSLKSYSISLTGLEDGACGSAFLVDETSYDEGRFSDPFHIMNNSFIPISLRWTLTRSDQVACCYNDLWGRNILNTFINGTEVDSWICYQSESLEGNVYLTNGCKYNYDYAYADNTEECKRCKDSGGYCTSTDIIYDVDGSVYSEKFSCSRDKRASLGVILVELLTGERPISLTRFGENKSLATHFMLAMEEGRVMSIFDAVVVKEGARDELLIVANLAMQCLHNNGKYRPTMKEVAIELETIRRSHVPSTVQTKAGPVVYDEESTMLTYGESSSTFMSCNDTISQ
ncbi:hypothetical protein QVD17_37372 [Tagetes erecta]|uniref:Uncharacterized protein n=1 Tax=Tagetes erecta TaxID=13708 RepID=A0AAD8JY42_TARER|nr:hypothetical protein QVD17_37372 [Tagetes erecta]